MRVAKGHGAVAGIGVTAEQDAHGPSHDIAAPDDHGMPAFGLDPVVFKQQQDAVGGGRQERGKPLHHAARRFRVEPVHVLVRPDGLDHFLVTDMRGQRQLHQDAIHIVMLVQRIDLPEQLLLGDVRGQSDQGGSETYFSAAFDLGGHIGLTRAVVADEYCSQMGDLPALLLQLNGPGFEIILNRLRNEFAVEDLHGANVGRKIP